jgi:alkanesulfonate monooxygenase SsuD/methylene tetrahydromethanopterin reductase-like flavin-dependent oxidoreductase (luciferase family)
MRLGINLPSRRADGTPLSMTEVLTRARRIEEAGFDSIWIGDTVYRGQHVSPDPLLWLLAAASVTQRIELGVAVLQLPLREPFELAQRLITMNALTGGRFSLGVGAGSTKTDFDAVGVDYAQRFKLLSKSLPILKRLLNGEQVGTASLEPWAVPAGGPRMLIGAWSSGPWVVRAAKEYDGWLTSGRYTRGMAGLAEGIKRYREAGGRRALVANVHIDLSAPTTPLAADGSFNLLCSPEEAAARLRRIAALGYDDVLLMKAIDQTEQDLIEFRALLPRHSS